MIEKIPKWRRRIQSEYSVVDREGEIVTARELIETRESLQTELAKYKRENKRLRKDLEEWKKPSVVVREENGKKMLEKHENDF